jgi:glycosyltransferase involved in cell wall biosynthesis
MTVHFFTKGDANTASSRQRVYLVANELDKLGIKTRIHWPPVLLIRRADFGKKVILLIKFLFGFLKIRNKDILYLHRPIYCPSAYIIIVFYSIIFKLFGGRIIFDFDDAIYIHSPIRTKILAKLSNIMIVGSHALMDWAKQYSKTFLIPTSIPFFIYNQYSRLHKNNIDHIFTIGWVGDGPAHYENLIILIPVFEQLIKKGIIFKFVLVGALHDKMIYDAFTSIKGLDVDFIDNLNWSDPVAVPQKIQNFDIGLMPLIDSDFSKGKAAFKAIEYMACSVPPVISNVGENGYLVKNGENGFLVNNTNDWVNVIERLYYNRELIIKIGENAEKTIMKFYSFEANIPILRSILLDQKTSLKP